MNANTFFLEIIVGNIYGHWFREETERISLMCTPRKKKKKIFFHMKSDTQMFFFFVFVQCDMRRFSGSRKKNFHVFFFSIPINENGKKFTWSCKILICILVFNNVWEIVKKLKTMIENWWKNMKWKVKQWRWVGRRNLFWHISQFYRFTPTKTREARGSCGTKVSTFLLFSETAAGEKKN